MPRKPRDEPKKKPGSAPEKLARPFAGALAELKAELKRAAEAPPEPPPPKAEARAAPSSPRHASPVARPADPLGHHAYADRAAFQQAYAGVRPLDARATETRAPLPEATALEDKVAADLAAADEAARARLDALVAGNVGFVIRRSTRDGEIEGVREGERESVLRTITGPRVVPQGTCDLHGHTGTEAERELARFVRSRHARGDRVLLVVHGKGLHSDGGLGVLEDHVVRCLTEGGAAPLVRAFVTAPERFGGRGALVVLLVER